MYARLLSPPHALLPTLATIGVMVTMIAGCGGDDPVVPPAEIVIPGPNESVDYRTHVEPIFLNSCAGSDCHIGGRRAGLSVANYEDLIEGSDFGAVVIPFSPERSHLFQHINVDTALGPVATPRMPASRDPLPLDQITTIRRWIAEGARGPDGDVPLAGENRSRIFVTCQSEDLVAVIDRSTGLIARFLTVGSRPDIEAPHNILLAPDGRSFYIVLIAAGTVEKFDAATFERLGSIEVGLSPAQLRITADGSRLYASNFDLTFQQPFVYTFASTMSGSAEAIDIEGNAPHGITLGPDEKFLYTMNAGSDDISVLDLATREVIARIPIVPGSPPAPAGGAVHEPYQSEIAADGNLWVTCRKSGEVRVVDLAARRVIDSIPVGSRPLIPGLNSQGTELWVPNQGSNTLSVIDVATRRVSATIGGLDDGPHAVSFTPEGDQVWVTCENLTGSENLHHPLEGTDVVPGLLYRIDPATRSIVEEFEVGGFAAGIGIQRR